ncbi:metal-dependent protein-like protein [Alkaliphilus metalliredigens QYMF]|uniref:Metal-dependent protein-like protein n=1 Tax=Alkaliphilus metalliredigens (strain QYMF) TaxID=293826 RepID=A6TMZ2_ALKMQ|nr:DUF1385 domain-containing protein [Alkaliphilus metalliredigens]ABR47560.1 metal-dependent protein-like protein [Alkaliphilus metalliredigens QYMF]
MKLGGYAHFNGITFFTEAFKIKTIKRQQKMHFEMKWIQNPKWMRKIEKVPLLGGISVLYYQWNLLSKKIRALFILMILMLIAEEYLSSSFFSPFHAVERFSFLIYGGILLFAFINLKNIIRLFRYHGAEHKVINCYLAHGYVTIDLVKKASRFNSRCGSNIAGIFLLFYGIIWWLGIDSLVVILIFFLLAIQIAKFFAVRQSKMQKYISFLQWITVLEPKEAEMKLAVAGFYKLQIAYDICRREKAQQKINEMEVG